MSRIDKALIIYHREDNDGVVSAAITWDYLKHHAGPIRYSIDMFPADYNKLKELTFADIDEYRRVYDKLYLLDVSFNTLEMMKHIYDVFGEDFIWVDHHKPVIDASFEMGFSDAIGYRNSDDCTIINAWRYFYDMSDETYRDKKFPELWRILSAWDSWTYEREGYEKDYVYCVNKGVVECYNLDFVKMLELVYKVHDDFNEGKTDFKLINYFFDCGHLIADYEKKEYARLIAEYADEFTVGPDNRPAIALFKQGSSNSMMFESCGDEIKSGIVFKRNKNGMWSINLYNIHDVVDGFHCGKYLKEMYDGGGHEGAAGCVVPEEKFMEILKTKHL